MLRNTCIQGVLDTDFYKLTMLQAYQRLVPNQASEWTFQCRNDEDLTPYLELMREELAGLARMSISLPELKAFSRSATGFSPDFLEFLYHFRFDPALIETRVQGSRLHLSVQGPLFQASMLEIPVLATLSELRNTIRYPEIDAALIEKVTLQRIADLQRLGDDTDLSEFRFAEFGTRRRFSFAAQKQVLGLLKQHVPQCLLGTSNPLLAQHYALPLIGTMGHEWLQSYQGLDLPLASSQKQALAQWLMVYPQGGVALTDVIGIEAFCRDLDFTLANQYSGFRHDSGDPIAWGETLLARLEALGVDPLTKTLVFSDGLDFTRAVALYRHFRGRTRCSFGIGTWLTGNFELNRPLNSVLKMVRFNGHSVAKISDSPAKNVCRDPRFLQQLMDAFAVSQGVRQQIMSQLT